MGIFQTNDILSHFDNEGDTVTYVHVNKIINDYKNFIANGDDSDFLTYKDDFTDIFNRAYGNQTINHDRLYEFMCFAKDECFIDFSNPQTELNFNAGDFNCNGNSADDEDMKLIDRFFQSAHLWMSINGEGLIIKYLNEVFDVPEIGEEEGDKIFISIAGGTISTKGLINVFWYFETKSSDDTSKHTRFNFYAPWKSYVSDTVSVTEACGIIENMFKTLYDKIFNIYTISSYTVSRVIISDDTKTDRKLYIKYNGDIPCSYTWYKQVSGSWTVIQGATESEYVIPEDDLAVSDSNSISEVRYKVKIEDSRSPSEIPQGKSKLSAREYIMTVYIVKIDRENLLLGDLNDDNVVNILDVYRLKKLFSLRTGDVDFDGKVTAQDASGILQIYAMLSTQQSIIDSTSLVYNDYFLQRGQNQYKDLWYAINYYGEDLFKAAILPILDFSYGIKKDSVDDGYEYVIDASDASYVLKYYAVWSTLTESGTSSSVKEWEGVTVSKYSDMPIYTLGNCNYYLPIVTKSLIKGLVMLDREETRRSVIVESHVYKILQSIKNKDVKLY